MSSTSREDVKDTPIQDSWIDLTMSVSPPLDGGPTVPIAPGTIERKLLEAQTLVGGDPMMTKPLSHSNMEKLLLEAQREWSRNSSRMGSNVASTTSSRSSPKSPRSPNNELAGITLLTSAHKLPKTMDQTQQTTTDWIWDWDSRPEVLPPGLKPPLPRVGLSVRNTKMMADGAFSMENLPIMLLTHACTFFLGAAVMFVYLKKYCGWSNVLPATMD